MAGYKPTIFLRNAFRLKWDEQKDYASIFLKGKKRFLEETKGKGWTLMAAFAEWPLLNNKRVVEQGFEIVQIWRLDDWQTLYRTMVDLSETSWYRSLGESLASEDQELLINAGVREPAPNIHWRNDDEPGYCYLYEVSRPIDGRSHAYLREVNWLDAQLSADAGWELAWWATQITAQPAKIALLWRVRDSGGLGATTIPQKLVDVAQLPRYRKRLMDCVQTLERRILYPIYTERLAEKVAAGIL